MTRVGWGRLSRSESGEPLISEEAFFWLLFRAKSRHFLDLELDIRLEELSGVTGFFSNLLEDIVRRLVVLKTPQYYKKCTVSGIWYQNN